MLSLFYITFYKQTKNIQISYKKKEHIKGQVTKIGIFKEKKGWPNSCYIS